MPLPTIEDVARLAGVSVETASRVVSFSPLAGKDARAKVERAVGELGHVPAPLVKPRPANAAPLVAVVHAFSAVDAGDGSAGHGEAALLGEVLLALDAALAGTGLEPLLHRVDVASRNLTRDFSDFLELRRPAGVLLLPPVAEHDDLAGLCWEHGCRHVRIASAMADHPENLVASADRHAAAQAVHALAALGHSRIAAIAGPDGDRCAQERELGYLDALADIGLDRGPALVTAGDWSFASGREAARLLLQVSPRPTAILAMNDEMAAGALHAAHELKLAVPGALSLVGFGDTPLASRVWPPLASVRVPLAEMVRTAALKLVQPEMAARLPFEFVPELVLRGSAGPAPDQVSCRSARAFQSG